MDEPLVSLIKKTELMFDTLRSVLPPHVEIDWSTTTATTWRVVNAVPTFRSIQNIDSIQLEQLLEIDRQKSALVDNTAMFCKGYPANHALLWGARGTGKSSLIHAVVNKFSSDKLRLIEVEKSSFAHLNRLIEHVDDKAFRFLIFCDDLSFDTDDTSYKQLKSVIEGSIFAAADNVLIYVTSNRRHLVAEEQTDNRAIYEQEIHSMDKIDEKISLSDRFGLWLAFHPFNQEQYLNVVNHWIRYFAKIHDSEIVLDAEVRKKALQWALDRGDRNGRVAANFAKSLVGQHLLDTP